MELGIRLKNIRESKNLSQEHVGNELGIGQSAYSKIENEKRELTVKELLLLADILQVDVSDLLQKNVSPSDIKAAAKVVIEVELNHQDFVMLGLKDRIIDKLK